MEIALTYMCQCGLQPHSRHGSVSISEVIEEGVCGAKGRSVFSFLSVKLELHWGCLNSI